jgi:hypothetical protein
LIACDETDVTKSVTLRTRHGFCGSCFAETLLVIIDEKGEIFC